MPIDNGFLILEKSPEATAQRLFTVLMVDLTRFELVTSRLSAGRSNQLSYRSIMVEVRGIEPLTSGLQSPRSPS